MAITRPTFNVLMADGTLHEAVPVTERDKRRMAETSAHKGWGAVSDDNPMSVVISQFLVYAAMVRTGRFSGSFDAFTDSLDVIEQAGTETVGPTETATLTD